MSARHLAFAKIVTGNLALLETFYETAFDMRVTGRVSFGEGEAALEETILAMGEGKGSPLILIRYPNLPVPAAGELVVGLGVEDVAASVEAAVAAGGTLVIPPVDATEHGIRLAFVKDPEGHMLELVQPLAG
jgi:predicted enzyme related to lactoylglutathione lyase